MQSTQEIVELILDSNRNALLTLDLKVGVICSDNPCQLTHHQVSILTLGVGTGALVAGLFGMNVRACLLTFLDVSKHLFTLVDEPLGNTSLRILCSLCGSHGSCNLRGMDWTPKVSKDNDVSPARYNSSSSLTGYPKFERSAFPRTCLRDQHPSHIFLYHSANATRMGGLSVLGISDRSLTSQVVSSSICRGRRDAVRTVQRPLPTPTLP